ncbi:carboxy-S-adenosyl-L-methionine synthase CmoA [Idiomarina xiamenensis]|uniref:Carboxy-S-adenosyl-L-methionine synthase n=1 Tax=Idiomarina xiamenensis 10-D-4 TaxID=740709 RepID=K2KT37_9GAMM|nr:carboxy-S-adenosyl-L-methionine synthase CmoA [Idiomarina xiamenensis]EKE80795.1 SAM-dependent methyltransferase [Idiomarina xiamenensis 10-D-4]
MHNDNQHKRDALFAEPAQQVADFCFDERVVEVFPDMISRSVPGYQTIVNSLTQFVRRFAQPQSNLYDLGCSLGAATIAIRQGCEHVDGCQIIAVDNSEAMIKRCRMHVDGYKGRTPVTIRCEDLAATPIDNASVVVLNFTLQFVPPAQRAAVIQRIYDGMRRGAVLLVAEKLKHDDTVVDELLVDLHHDFKRANGYSDLEISQKRAAIENVMRIDSLATHFQRFHEAGFKHHSVWYQCLNFAAMLAIK